MDLGQVFTDRTVAEYMVSMFQLERDALILDPCFGAGAFLGAGMQQGFTNIEGYEIDKGLYENVKTQFPQFRLYNKNFLKASNKRKYDGIIMNPPYIRQEKIDDLAGLGITKGKLRKNKIYEQLPCTANMYMYFIFKALDLLKEEGEMVVIYVERSMAIKMEIYFAPMEGITGYIYRNAFHDYYTGVDKYFTPFLSPNQNRGDYFQRAAEELKEKYGYGEVNLNLGCPSRTVVSKGKGAGFLAKPKELDDFFREVFDNIESRVSVKARIGVDEPKEFRHLMEIFNKYPLCELIIHPRVQKDYYGNRPDLEAFGEAVQTSRIPLCYNGDIFTLEDYRRLKGRFPGVKKIMLGRGLLMNPALAEMIKAEEAGRGKAAVDKVAEAEKAIDAAVDKERLKGFHDRLYGDYKEVMSGEKNVLFKMKEFWVYAGKLFPGEEKQLKKIKKASRAGEYESAVEEILA